MNILTSWFTDEITKIIRINPLGVCTSDLVILWFSLDENLGQTNISIHIVMSLDWKLKIMSVLLHERSKNHLKFKTEFKNLLVCFTKLLISSSWGKKFLPVHKRMPQGSVSVLLCTLKDPSNTKMHHCATDIQPNVFVNLLNVFNLTELDFLSGNWLQDQSKTTTNVPSIMSDGSPVKFVSMLILSPQGGCQWVF